MDQVREVEHKFRVHGLYRIPDLTRVEGIVRVVDHGTVDLAAIYYDTDDLRLVRDGITLRRRVGGSDEGWHLKLPTSTVGTRDELHVPLTSAEAGPPKTLTDIVTVITRDRLVEPVATLNTSRHRRMLHGLRDEPVAELVDDHVAVVSSDGATTAQFRELELELTSGGDAIAGVISALSAAGASEGEFVAKAVRALGPDAAAAPEVPEPAQLGPSASAGDHVAAYLATHIRALRWHDINYRRDPVRPGDHVHQMRVSARRLRSGLRVFAPLLDNEWAQQLADELRWFARGLTTLRETEVILPRLEADVRQLPDAPDADRVLDLIRDRLGGTLAQAQREALELASTKRYFALHDRLVDAVQTPRLTGEADTPAEDVFPELAGKPWKKLVRSARKLDSQSPDERWHEVRLAAKRARYAGEAVAPALGPDAADYVKRIKQLTNALGEHQDAVQAAERAHELAMAGPGTDTEVAFRLGQIAGFERAKTLAARDTFGSAWRKSDRAGKLLNAD